MKGKSAVSTRLDILGKTRGVTAQSRNLNREAKAGRLKLGFYSIVAALGHH